MLIDQKNVYSDGQAITVDAASTNVIDLGAAGRAPGNPLEINVLVTEAFNTLTSLAVQFQSSVDEAFTSPITHSTTTVLLADLTLGKKIDIGSMPDGTKRYTRLYYDVTGTAPTLGKVTAAILPFGQQTFVNQA